MKSFRRILREAIDNEFLYHGTSEGAFRQIRIHGLKCNGAGEIFFSTSEQYSRSYASRKGIGGELRMLRVEKTDDFKKDARIPRGGDYISYADISPDRIELQTLSGWIPIQAYHDEDRNIMPILREAIDITDNSNFWKWFGDSKVVDAHENPLVVCHGTPSDFNTFGDEHNTPRSGGFVGAFMFTRHKKYAGEYANKSNTNGRVVEVYLKLTNPVPDYMGIQIKQSAIENGTTIAHESIKLGYDGKLVKADGKIAYIIYKPENIKSATGNNGDFDPSNPDITK